jgi:hypothetical protein
VNAEVAFALVYAASLTAAAFALEALSAHTYRRALRFRTAGFRYVDGHDYWLCPEGEHLLPHHVDLERRLIRYRARAHVCNGCVVKDRCTDSDRGREIVAPLDPWPHSEAGRFHRVIALLLVGLAALIVVGELVRNHNPWAVALLLGLLVIITFGGRWLVSDLRRHPANFPTV